MLVDALSIAIAFLVAYFVTPFVIKAAYKWKALDDPCARKIHSCVMPRMGGVAIYVGFVMAILFTQNLTTEILGLLAGCTLIILLGIVDDVWGLTPKAKLGGQILAAAIVILFGIRVDFLTNPFSEMIFLYKLAVPFTILWIVGITNAVNLIDGLDGLAAGTSGIAAVTIGIIAGLEGNATVAILSLILAAAIFGFLPFNFYPAKIFMGDAGSMFLGFTLSVLAVIGLTKSATIMSVFIPIIILGIPILDTLTAIIRRYLNGKPIFQADREHLHHQLLCVGLTHKQAVLIMYVVNLCLGGSAIFVSLLAPDQAVLILIGLAVLMVVAVNRLNFAVFASKQKAKDLGS